MKVTTQIEIASGHAQTPPHAGTFIDAHRVCIIYDEMKSYVMTPNPHFWRDIKSIAG